MTQEQIEKALEEHINRELYDATNHGYPIQEVDVRKAFKKGAELVNKYWQEKTRWMPINERMPPVGIEVLFQNDKWIDEDFNPKGIRIGFLDGDDIYYSAYYCGYHDEYHTRNSHEDDSHFKLEKAIDQIPTKWKETD